MAIEIFEADGTKLGELDPVSPGRPAKGDFLCVGGTGGYEVVSVVLPLTVSTGTPDLWAFGGSGTIIVRQKSKCDLLAHRAIMAS